MGRAEGRESEERQMLKTTLKIDGMMCSMCEAHINEVIRKAVPGAKKVSASHTRGEASFVSDKVPVASDLRAAIAATGYTCTDVTTEPWEKKGLFGLFS